jgi:hypothetical protein
MTSHSKIDKFIELINNKFNIPTSSLHEIYKTINDNNDDLFNNKITELRTLCELHGLTKNGNKNILIEKILKTTNPNTRLYLKSITALKDLCKQNKLKVTGSKNDMVLRLYSIYKDDNSEDDDDDSEVDNFILNLCSVSKNFEKLKKSELVQLCNENNLDVNGTKAILVNRLQNM